MEDKFPVRSAAREMKAKRRLNSENPVCILCGFSKWEVLIPVSLQWLEDNKVPFTIFEAHHIVGRAHDPELTIPICRNCHALATEDLRRADVSMRPLHNSIELIIARLSALATFLERLAISIREWVRDLSSAGNCNE